MSGAHFFLLVAGAKHAAHYVAPYQYQLLVINEIVNTRIPHNTSIAPNEKPRQRMNILLKVEKRIGI